MILLNTGVVSGMERSGFPETRSRSPTWRFREIAALIPETTIEHHFLTKLIYTHLKVILKPYEDTIVVFNGVKKEIIASLVKDSSKLGHEVISPIVLDLNPFKGAVLKPDSQSGSYQSEAERAVVKIPSYSECALECVFPGFIQRLRSGC